MTLEEALKKISELEAQIAALAKEKDDLQKEKAALEGDKRTAEVDALLSSAGYQRTADGKGWQGLSAATLGVLLAASAEDAKAMIADLAPRREQEAQAAAWLTGTQTPAAGKDTTLSDNPLLADVEARGKAGTYI